MIYDTPDARAANALREYQEFEGMLGALDAGVMVALLVLQNQTGISGNIAEFGVFKGRSASILARFQNPGEELFLVDVADYLDEKRMRAISDSYRFLKMDSAHFCKSGPKNVRRKSFRFIHADGSHTFDNVYSDMAIADKILANRGIFVIDDYCNPNYPQVAAAVHTYLALKRTDLCVFLISRNKCFVCRRSYVDALRVFVLADLLDALSSYGSAARLSKTDRNAKFDCVSVTPRPDSAPEEEFYGMKLYGHLYKPEDRNGKKIQRFIWRKKVK